MTTEKRWICETCGTQFAPSADHPTACPICQDERQYVAARGQTWTTLTAMRQGRYKNLFSTEEPGITSIKTEPSFAIGQRALLLQTPDGNVLWDCLSYIDAETIARINELGGIKAIAISHPHYYTTARDWAQAFGAKVYLHSADRQWVMDPGPEIVHWEGERLELLPGVTLLNLGGHFPGSAVLHFAGGADGQGALMTGDTIQVVPDTNWVSFMYSYPNQIPLPAFEVERMVGALEGYPFERIYGFASGRNLVQDAQNAVKRSRDRYIQALQMVLHKR